MNSFPSPTFSAPQFESQNDQNPLTISTTSNSLLITNIKQFPKEAPFSIIIEGIKNPLQPPFPTSIGWTIKSMYQGKTINYLSNFDTFTYGAEFVPGTVIFLSIDAFPLNAN
jgi:hypothetical protein